MALDEFVLRIEGGRSDPVEHRCSGTLLVIGRSSSADVVIPDPYLSRRQAQLVRRDDGWYIEDLGGRNGTLLNGRPVAEPTRLSVGDVIKMSDTVLRVAPPPDAPASDSGAVTAADSGALYRPASALIERAAAIDAAQSPEGLRRQARRLQLLNDVHRALAVSSTLEELFNLILDRVFAELVPEEAVIFLKDARGEFYRAATRRLPGVGGDYLYSRSLVHEVTEKHLAALVFDARSDARFAAAESIAASGVRSLVAAPLLDTEGCPGMIVLSSRAHVRRFAEEDMELLVSLASVAALRIRNIALADEGARRRALEKELELARQIQVGLFPERLPEVPGYELRAFNAPSRAISGDLYQAQVRKEGRDCVLLVADVSGKGIAAALLTASLEALATGPIEVGLPPEEICAKLSRRLYARTSAERYATAFVAVLQHEEHRMRYANAGHNPALLVHADGGCQHLAATGIPLGLLPVADYTGEELHIEPGDTLLVYTDGLTEAANPAGEEYGVDRLVAVLRRHVGSPLDTLVEDIEQDIEGFAGGVPYADDRTFVLLRRVRSG